MSKKTKDIINKLVNTSLKSGIFLLVTSFVLMCANFGFGIKMTQGNLA